MTDTSFIETTNPVQTAKARTPIHRLHLPGALPAAFLLFAWVERVMHPCGWFIKGVAIL
jgi:hypothetical protein